MNLKVGEVYWTIEPLPGNASPVREPWIGTWVRKIEYSDEVFRLHDPSRELKGHYSHSRPNPTMVYATELEAKKAYVSAKLQEAHDLMARAKQITGAMKEYVKSNEDLKRTFRAQDGGDLQ